MHQSLYWRPSMPEMRIFTMGLREVMLEGASRPLQCRESAGKGSP